MPSVYSPLRPPLGIPLTTSFNFSPIFFLKGKCRYKTEKAEYKDLSSTTQKEQSSKESQKIIQTTIRAHSFIHSFIYFLVGWMIGSRIGQGKKTKCLNVVPNVSVCLSVCLVCRINASCRQQEFDMIINIYKPGWENHQCVAWRF